MTERPYHHGGLRTALLNRAERTLKTSGVEGLSLRELARDVGVSHGAPRRHFRDKAALLDALATDGFVRLREALERSAGTGGRSFVANMTEVAVTYVRFATANPALLELMFTSKHQADASTELTQAALECFTGMETLVAQGQQSGDLVPGDLQQIGMVLLAALQGITSLANIGMIEPDDLDGLTAYTVESLLRGLARHHLPAPSSQSDR